MGWTPEMIQNAVQSVVERAASDADFRTLAVSDIQSAVKVATGLDIPANFKINVVDGSGYHATVVLPEPKSAPDELSESELEGVAGGSKSEATEFFNNVGNTIQGVANVAVNTATNVVTEVIGGVTHAINTVQNPPKG